MKIYFCREGLRIIRELLQGELPHDEVLECAPERLAEVVGTADVLIPTITPLRAEVLAQSRARLIQQFGAGLDAVDIAAATRQGIPVANVPAAGTGNAESVAEMAVFLMLALARRFPETQQSIREGRIATPTGWALKGRTAVIVGYGGIGRETARRLAGFEMRVLAVSRSGPKNTPEEDAIPVARHYAEAGLHEALREADFVILAPPLNDQTRGLLGAAEFACLKPSAYVVNVARGGVIDYDALLAALREQRIAGAGLDVFWQEPIDPQDPLLGYNVIGTPHVGGATDLSLRGIARKVAANVERVRRGELPEDCVNAQMLKT
ncbi:MAG TPA: 2-hydroxyacid dehydrogenase [Porticoccaceae bacterium]|nr:2-hydroxyacid dehydrogenase [Porticoccaceae bacterium]